MHIVRADVIDSLPRIAVRACARAEIEKIFCATRENPLTSHSMVLFFTSLRAPEDDERASLVGIIEAESVAMSRVGSQESRRQIVDEAARRFWQKDMVFDRRSWIE